jgi:hypothetical protein
LANISGETARHFRPGTKLFAQGAICVALTARSEHPTHRAARLGGSPVAAWIDVPPAFAAQHLTVQVASGISTRIADRERSLNRLVNPISRQPDVHPDSCLARSALQVRRRGP